MPSIQKIAIIGAGAMVVVYAARFQETDAGAVALIAAGERARRFRQAGLVVNDRHFQLPVVEPGADPSPVGLDPSPSVPRPPGGHPGYASVVGAGTLVISVMNGIDSETLIGAVLGHERMLYAVAVGIDAVREEDGRVTYSTAGKILFGEKRNTTLSGRVQRVRSLFTRAGIGCEIPEDMRRTLWWKFMISVGINQASAVLRAPYGLFQGLPGGPGGDGRGHAGGPCNWPLRPGCI